MRLSTKGRFAVTAMIDLALFQRSGPVPLSAIAQRQQISLSYLEQMFSKLRLVGLVASTRGPGGGYTLGERGESITVADIIVAIESQSGQTADEGQAGHMANRDMTQALWDSLSSRLVDYMQSITLHSLTEEQLAKGFAVQPRKPQRHGVFRKSKPEPIRLTAPNSVFALGSSLLAKG
jgi:Rrf2 family iron-sulfur cluster assembly transcriptional regulator